MSDATREIASYLHHALGLRSLDENLIVAVFDHMVAEGRVRGGEVLVSDHTWAPLAPHDVGALTCADVPVGTVVGPDDAPMMWNGLEWKRLSP